MASPSFVQIRTKVVQGRTHVYPEFMVRGKDFMLKGGKFYAIYNEQTGLWSTDEAEVTEIVDRKIDEYAKEHYKDVDISLDHMNRSTTKVLKEFKEWTRQLPSEHNFIPLDSDITQIDEATNMKQYRSKKLNYKISAGPMDNYELFMNTCYAPDEREKLEWMVGAILCGDAKKIQKFIVMYGKPGTGKSTFLNIVQQIFEGYWSVIDVDSLVNRSSQFGTAALKNNPLVCIQHDADLSKIDKNDVLNSVVSHEVILVNEKNKPQYPLRSNAIIFIGTNDFVNITDTRQGVTRRMIDVYPTGEVLPSDIYNDVVEGVKFELGAIAAHCIDVYREGGATKYNKYKPSVMIKKTNVYTGFISERYGDLCDPVNDPISVRDLYRMFKSYMEDSGYSYIPTLARFKENMADFYDDFKERLRLPDGRMPRNMFVGFKKDCLDETMSCVTNKEVKVDNDESDDVVRASAVSKFIFKRRKLSEENVLDVFLADYPAQYSNAVGVPSRAWVDCDKVLRQLNTGREHYVKVPENLIVIDFDIKGNDGEKSLALNLEAANKWPLTYAELSKSGQGIHLHYIYDGDVNRLSKIYGPNIEVKVYTGNAALRRKLTMCNNEPIAHISSGLPFKEEAKMVTFDTLKNEKALRTVILRNLEKEYHPATKPSVDFIKKALDDAYASGMHYDVSDLQSKVLAFANNSTNNALYCVKLVGQMRFKSDDITEDEGVGITEDLTFVDCEVFPNVFILCYKHWKKDDIPHVLINPKPSEVEELTRRNLVGFNNRKYDNHIMYARIMGYGTEELYKLSKKLVSGSPSEVLAATFSEAYNMSYADIYDICTTKQSLKKWEIELGVHHQENSYPWDEPLAEEHWKEVADYCCNDVMATQAVWEHNKGDITAREILADLSGLPVNSTTRQHATKIIFEGDKHPELVYTDLSKTFPGYHFSKTGLGPECYNGYDPNDKKTWHTGFSEYLGEDPSEGGRVQFVPGIYYDVALLDVESLHPHSIKELNLFGKYTQNFVDILDARLAIKHGDLDKARGLLGGKLAKYLTDESVAADLAQALKIVINSVYGYTSAKFENAFRDARNVDNIVAKRGALFMILLEHELAERGITVIHTKTDSVKIPNATPETILFVKDFGKKYGYTFDHEATYEKMCLVNGSTYIAKVKSGKHAGKWVAVAAQFQHPYVLKTLFTKEPIIFEDMCETKEVKTSMVLDFNEGLPEGEHKYEFVGRIGLYVPVKPGCGGGLLLRDKGKEYEKAYEKWKAYPYDSKGKPKAEPERYSFVTGSGGYRWFDAEAVKLMPEKKQKEIIDYSYFNKLCDDAIAAIEQYGDYDQFINYKGV